MTTDETTKQAEAEPSPAPRAVIQPTVGRVVLYHPHRPIDGWMKTLSSGPLAAIVVHVRGVQWVNLVVFDAEGLPHSRPDVLLWNDDLAGDKPAEGFAEWMPYQKAQAAKNDGELAELLKRVQTVERVLWQTMDQLSMHIGMRCAPGDVTPQMPMPKFKGATCRGCYKLGTACGKCERCEWEMKQMAEVRASIAPRSEPTSPGDELGDAPGPVVTAHRSPGLNEALHIEATDQPGHGGAYHDYEVREIGYSGGDFDDRDTVRVHARIHFQNGPIAAHGVNGNSNECLLAIVAHRLECFQHGAYACEANGRALAHVMAAIDALHSRTRDRVQRGVEGTSKR